MPLYDFACPSCGRVFEQRAGYDDARMPCACGDTAVRSAVYVQQGVIFKGGGFTKSILPPKDQPLEVQAEWFKEVRKAGWSGDRAVETIRHNIRQDAEGKRYVDFQGVNKEAQGE